MGEDKSKDAFIQSIDQIITNGNEMIRHLHGAFLFRSSFANLTNNLCELLKGLESLKQKTISNQIKVTDKQIESIKQLQQEFNHFDSFLPHLSESKWIESALSWPVGYVHRFIDGFKNNVRSTLADIGLNPNSYFVFVAEQESIDKRTDFNQFKSILSHMKSEINTNDAVGMQQQIESKLHEISRNLELNHLLQNNNEDKNQQYQSHKKRCRASDISGTPQEYLNANRKQTPQNIRATNYNQIKNPTRDFSMIQIKRKVEELLGQFKSINISNDDILFQGQIGVGGFGSVSKAIRLSTSEVVAVKELRMDRLTTSSWASLYSELEAMANVHHSFILELVGAHITEPFRIITRYCSGKSLFDRLHKKTTGLEPLNATTLTIIAYQVAVGMKYLHSVSIVHRDLKTLNILLDENNDAFVADFGLSGMMKDNKDLIGGVGTPNYTAPEVLAHTRYGNKVDVYSYGIVLWEILTRKVPYSEMNSIAIFEHVVTRGWRLPIPNDIPAPIKKLITQCWSKNPNDRPTFTEIISRFEQGDLYFPGSEKIDFIAIKSKRRCPPIAFDYAMEVLNDIKSPNFPSICKFIGSNCDDHLRQKLKDMKVIEKLLKQFFDNEKSSYQDKSTSGKTAQIKTKENVEAIITLATGILTGSSEEVIKKFLDDGIQTLLDIALIPEPPSIRQPQSTKQENNENVFKMFSLPQQPMQDTQQIGLPKPPKSSSGPARIGLQNPPVRFELPKDSRPVSTTVPPMFNPELNEKDKSNSTQINQEPTTLLINKAHEISVNESINPKTNSETVPSFNQINPINSFRNSKTGMPMNSNAIPTPFYLTNPATNQSSVLNTDTSMITTNSAEQTESSCISPPSNKPIINSFGVPLQTTPQFSMTQINSTLEGSSIDIPMNSSKIPGMNEPPVPIINLSTISEIKQPIVPVMNSSTISGMNQSPLQIINSSTIPGMNQSTVPIINSSTVPGMNQPTVPVMNSSTIPGMNQPTVPIINSSTIPGMNQTTVPVMNSSTIPGMNQPTVPVMNSQMMHMINQSSEHQETIKPIVNGSEIQGIRPNPIIVTSVPHPTKVSTRSYVPYPIKVQQAQFHPYNTETDQQYNTDSNTSPPKQPLPSKKPQAKSPHFNPEQVRASSFTERSPLLPSPSPINNNRFNHGSLTYGNKIRIMSTPPNNTENTLPTPHRSANESNSNTFDKIPISSVRKIHAKTPNIYGQQSQHGNSPIAQTPPASSTASPEFTQTYISPYSKTLSVLKFALIIPKNLLSEMNLKIDLVIQFADTVQNDKHKTEIQRKQMQTRNNLESHPKKVVLNDNYSIDTIGGLKIDEEELNADRKERERIYEERMQEQDNVMNYIVRFLSRLPPKALDKYKEQIGKLLFETSQFVTDQSTFDAIVDLLPICLKTIKMNQIHKLYILMDHDLVVPENFVKLLLTTANVDSYPSLFIHLMKATIKSNLSDVMIKFIQQMKKNDINNFAQIDRITDTDAKSGNETENSPQIEENKKGLNENEIENSKNHTIPETLDNQTHINQHTEKFDKAESKSPINEKVEITDQTNESTSLINEKAEITDKTDGIQSPINEKVANQSISQNNDKVADEFFKQIWKDENFTTLTNNLLNSESVLAALYLLFCLVPDEDAALFLADSPILNTLIHMNKYKIHRIQIFTVLCLHESFCNKTTYLDGINRVLVSSLSTRSLITNSLDLIAALSKHEQTCRMLTENGVIELFIQIFLSSTNDDNKVSHMILRNVARNNKFISQASLIVSCLMQELLSDSQERNQIIGTISSIVEVMPSSIQEHDIQRIIIPAISNGDPQFALYGLQLLSVCDPSVFRNIYLSVFSVVINTLNNPKMLYPEIVEIALDVMLVLIQQYDLNELLIKIEFKQFLNDLYQLCQPVDSMSLSINGLLTILDNRDKI